MAAIAGVAGVAATAAAGTVAAAGSAAAVALGSVGCLVVKELSSQAFALSLGHLSDIMTYLTRRSDDVTRLICDELTKMVPTAKLKIIQCVLFDFEWLREESKTIDSLCERLTELAQSIHFHVQQIGLNIDAFNKLYFRSWRTLDVSLHLQIIRQHVHDLHETFELLKLMLPSCISLTQSRPRIHAIRKFQKLKSTSPSTKPSSPNSPTLPTTATTSATATNAVVVGDANNNNNNNNSNNLCTALVLSNSWVSS
jgi:hypothetical protein